jgi:hypothetical protein
MLASVFIPQVKAIVNAIPGEPYSICLLLLPFAWLAQRKAVLRRERSAE